MNARVAGTGGFHYLTGGPGTSHRSRWVATRQALERSGRRHTVRGPAPQTSLLKRAKPVVRSIVRCAGLMERGTRNALSPRIEQRVLGFPELPAAFDGYQILHVSDPHFEYLPGLAERAATWLEGLAVNLVAITGDLQGDPGAPGSTIEPLVRLLGALLVSDAVVAVLGNHDSAHMVAALESIGVRVLANEHAAITRGGSRLVLSGTDDPSHFYTEAATHTLQDPPEGFRVALVHSPELAQAAAAGGHALYLCGHTHGGQICLPGGRPILTALKVNRHLARGWWREGGMIGHTSSGLGSSVVPVRFFCPPMMDMITLQRS